MPSESLLESVTAAHVERIRKVDELVAGGGVPSAASGALIEVDGAAAIHRVVDTDSDSLGATWSELRRHSLSQIRIAGPDAAEGMRLLLAAWRERLAEYPVPDHGESTAVLSWASRDDEVVKVLRGSGLVPTTVLAARTSAAAPRRELAGVTVRQIDVADLGVVTQLHEMLVRFDDSFGGAHWRPSTSARMREFVADVIESPHNRAWVAEVDGQVIGACSVEWPDTAGWATAGVAVDPGRVAYIGTVFVAPSRRGSGIGSVLVGHVHRELELAGILLPVLHYAPMNPLSTAFWLRTGYRPVMTTWSAQPHTVLRENSLTTV
jgi:GNAT superfamily N-acetyltransferase